MLWRHGRTAWNAEDRFQGQTDVPLDDVGRGQARRTARLLAALRPDVIVSSDLQRAAATAEELVAVTGVPVLQDPGLRESYGAGWQGLTGAEIRARYVGDFEQWRRGGDLPAEGAETRQQVADRAVAAIGKALVDVPAGGVLVAVTHGGAARAAIGRMLGLPREHWTALGGLSNCCWSVLEERADSAEAFRLVEHNAGGLPEPVIGDEE